MARKSGEAMVYRRLSVPKINEIDPTDNPQAGDLWIDFSVDPPVVNLLNKVLSPIIIGGGGVLTPPINITGDGSTVTLTVGQPRGSGLADALVINDTTDSILTARFSTSVSPPSGAQLFLTHVGSGIPALIVKQRTTPTGSEGLVQFQDTTGNSHFEYDGLAGGTGSIIIGNRTGIAGTNTAGNLSIGTKASQTIDNFQVWNSGAAAKLFSITSAGVVSITPATDVVPLVINLPAGALSNFVSYQLNTFVRFIVDVSGNITFGAGVAAPTVGSTQIGLGATTATSATAGANGAVPAQVVGYWIVNIGGTSRKIPFFAT